MNNYTKLNPETHIYDVHAYKGGVGVTTTACALAMHLADEGHKTLLVDGKNDVHAFLGLPTPAYRDNPFTDVIPNLQACAVRDTMDILFVDFPRVDFIVVDNGQNSKQKYAGHQLTHRVCVVRNDYMTLRNTIDRFQSDEEFAVTFLLNNSALLHADIDAVLRTESLGVPLEESVQRAIDAGMTVNRRKEKFAWASIIHDNIVASVGAI